MPRPKKLRFVQGINREQKACMKKTRSTQERRFFEGKEVFDMPGFDGTGPVSAGPMTGGARGFCNPSGRPYAAPGFGGGRWFGAGFRSGFGRGWSRRGVYSSAGGWYGPGYNNYPYGNPGTPYAMKPEDEIKLLKGEADAINKRIKELEAKSAAT